MFQDNDHVGVFHNYLSEGEDAIKINPNYADAYHNIANTYKQINDLENAKKYYKKAIIKAEGITYKAYLEDGDKWDNDYSYEDWSDNWELCDHILIVGNIYETPELLNNKD